jgi:hypothetical protein
MTTQRNLRAVPAPATEREQPPDLRDAVADSIKHMDWLTKSDQALAALALRHAEEIESAIARSSALTDLKRDAAGDESLYKRIQKLEAMCDVTKTVGWLGPQLQGLLRDLGGTPASRKAMREDKPIGGRLAQLRAAASGVDNT